MSKYITKDSLVSYLNDYLAIRDVPDYPQAYNGLQVDGKQRGSADIRRVALTVDACFATLQQAVEANADLLIVHHGLFWGTRAPITGMLYRRLGLLFQHDMPLYSCHTPLDAHPEVGNNAVLTRLLGLEPTGMWGEMEGVPIGTYADAELSRADLVERIRAVLGIEPHCIATGPEQIRRLGVVTGAAGGWVERARARGIDTLLTGEGPHHTYFDAEEHGLNLIFAGHYATETVGLKALAAHLEAQFDLETLFLDHPTGL